MSAEPGFHCKNRSGERGRRGGREERLKKENGRKEKEG